MTTKLQLLLITLTFFAAASIGTAQTKRSMNPASQLPDSAFNRWVEFKPPDGRFSILFPGVATMRFMDDEQSSDGRKKYYATYQSTIKYSVMSYEHPENLEAPIVAKDVIDSTRDAGIAASAQAGEKPSVISETVTNFEGHPARVLQISMAGGGRTWCKFIVVKNHFYFIEVVLPSSGGRVGISVAQGKIAEFFLNSFRLYREVA